MKVYWSRCGRGPGNFGDRLTPLLLERFGVRPEWAPPEHAELIGVGSVLEKVPETYHGVIWSSGLMHADSRKTLLRARIAAIRGRLTLERIGGVDPGTVALGDGGLLSHLFFRPTRQRFKLGLVPHFVDAGDPVVAAIASRSGEITVIDVCQEPPAVIQAIGQCEHVLSSSLHGLVVADSLGVPNCWMELNRGPEPVWGGGFKFRDYHSNFGLEAAPLQAVTGDTLDTLLPRFTGYRRPGIEAMQQALAESLQALLAALGTEAPADRARLATERRAWMARLTPALAELAAIVPPEAFFILVDEDQLRAELPPGKARPFLERQGQYWGPPPDDEAAMRELERMRAEGAGFIVFAWPAFWWLDHYAGFQRHLAATYPRVLASEHLVIFDLRGGAR